MREGVFNSLAREASTYNFAIGKHERYISCSFKPIKIEGGMFSSKFS